MKHSKLLFPPFLFWVSFYIVSCRRIPDASFEINYEQRFFTVPANTDPLVKILSQRIYQQNQRNNFVNDLVKKLWRTQVYDPAMV